MNKTKIEYLNYCWNFYPGCRNGCSYCWARKRAIRFNNGDFEPRLRPELLLDPINLKKPSRIGVCFTGDLFGDWVDPKQLICWQDSPGTVWLGPERAFALDEDALTTGSLSELLFYVIKRCPQHTFIFLTKQPQCQR